MSVSATRVIPHALTTLDGDFTVITVPGRAEAEVGADHQSSGAQGVELDQFRGAMRNLPGGVVMVTTRIAGRPWGLTISSCCSITAEPPQIMISLQGKTASCQQILRDRRFGIGILGREHRSLAELGAMPGVAKFIDEYCDRDGCPRLASPMIANALCHLDCHVAHTYRVGDHHLIIGLVEDVVTGPGSEDILPRSPLIYFDREFWALGTPAGE